ncbi:uncharacterized protein LOC121382326 [Gigantopelta aegis]|uniref:uncharacterized protein LOC121382326 n=1 Tax=Gigantopelta aegis TaxID=1735272 RepID=UPI001B88D1DB|nr:uncharacterized protein LOC121382326 [Gigantopelta aegis]
MMASNQDDVSVLNVDKKDSVTEKHASIAACELSKKLQKIMLRLKGEFMSEDGKKINYNRIKGSPLFAEYKQEAKQLQNVDLESLSELEKKVFFINTYNALTIHGLAEQQTIPDSVLRIQQFWKTTGYNIGGHVFTLDDIEHGILRSNRGHPASIQPQFPPKDPRLKFIVKQIDPRIHFALVCGAKSCPAINVYTTENIENALMDATKNFCKQEVSMFTETEEIWLSKLFQWYRQDFGETDVHVVRWTIPYLEPNIQDRAEILLMKLTTQGTVSINYNYYDWALNAS